jgi:hypothetical protein
MVLRGFGDTLYMYKKNQATPKMAEIEELLDVNPVPFYCFCLHG